MSIKKNEELLSRTYIIDEDGSLGLLAYGDLGLRAWRELKLKKTDKLGIDEKK